MARVALTLALALAAATTPLAHAQIADSGIVSVIERDAAQYGLDAGCMLNLDYRESGGDPYAVNPATGATGPFQFTPSGIWLSTLYGQQGIPPSAVSPEEQTRMAAMLMAAGHGDAWGVWC
jgi:hypothetical protein